MTTLNKINVTLADLQRFEAEDRNIEVENGEIIESELHVTWVHLLIIRNLFRLLDAHAQQNQLGDVFMDGARYVLKGTPDHIEEAPKPDLSFLSAGRIPADFDWDGDFFGAPDLAVEIISPGQGMTNLVRKLLRYLEAGTTEAWLILPKRGELHQYRQDADEPVVYRFGDIFETPLFPDLKISIDEIFKK